MDGAVVRIGQKIVGEVVERGAGRGDLRSRSWIAPDQGSDRRSGEIDPGWFLNGAREKEIPGPIATAAASGTAWDPLWCSILPPGSAADPRPRGRTDASRWPPRSSPCPRIGRSVSRPGTDPHTHASPWWSRASGPGRSPARRKPTSRCRAGAPPGGPRPGRRRCRRRARSGRGPRGRWTSGWPHRCSGPCAPRGGRSPGCSAARPSSGSGPAARAGGGSPGPAGWSRTAPRSACRDRRWSRAGSASGSRSPGGPWRPGRVSRWSLPGARACWSRPASCAERRASNNNGKYGRIREISSRQGGNTPAPGPGVRRRPRASCRPPVHGSRLRQLPHGPPEVPGRDIERGRLERCGVARRRIRIDFSHFYHPFLRSACAGSPEGCRSSYIPVPLSPAGPRGGSSGTSSTIRPWTRTIVVPPLTTGIPRKR